MSHEAGQISRVIEAEETILAKLKAKGNEVGDETPLYGMVIDSQHSFGVTHRLNLSSEQLDRILAIFEDGA